MQTVAQIMRQWCGIAALVLSPTLAWAACPALPSAVVPYTVFSDNGSAAVTTQATITADATIQGAVAYDTAASALKVCDGTSWQTLGSATPAGLSGYVQFSNGSAFASDSGLFWNNVNKRLGVGTTTPSTRLHVKSNSETNIATFGNEWPSGGTSNVLVQIQTNQLNGNYAGLYLVRGGNMGGYITAINNGINIGRSSDGSIPDIYIQIAGGAAVEGRVGIGTINPFATLDVNGYIKLRKNASAPIACSVSYDGSIALTSARRMCVCDGTSWTEVNSATACTW